jgi:hypothetical protein
MLLALTLWGWRYGAWQAPAIMLMGYIGMRVAVHTTPDELLILAGFYWWLCVICLLVMIGAYLPAALLLPAIGFGLLMGSLGFRIEWMGLIPVVEEVFALLAILATGGGIYGLSHHWDDSPGLGSRLVALSTGVAPRVAGDSRGI